MNNNSILKKFLPIIAIPVLGYILLLLTFILDALFQSTINKFFPLNYDAAICWFPMILYTVVALIYGSIILYLYKTNKSWIFYYSVTLVTLTLFIMNILGIDI